MNPKHVAYLSD